MQLPARPAFWLRFLKSNVVLTNLDFIDILACMPAGSPFGFYRKLIFWRAKISPRVSMIFARQK